MKWIVLILITLALSLVFQMGLLAYAIYTLTAIAVGSRYLANYWIRQLDASRHVSHTQARVGDRVVVTLELHNRGKLPIPWMLIEDVLPLKALLHDPPALAVDGRRAVLAMFRPGKRLTVRYYLTCNRCGYFQIGPLLLETGDLFGLYRKFRLADVPEFLLVLPKPVPLAGYDLASRRPVGEVQLVHRLYEDPTRIAGVREYQLGDPLRRVHWKATARTGKLHSKVYEPSTLAGATLLLDFHRASLDPKHEPVRSQLIVTAAASIGQALYEMGQQVGLVSNGRDAADRVRVEGFRVPRVTRKTARRLASDEILQARLRPVVVPNPRGPETLRRVMETLARLEPNDGLTLPQLVAETAGRLPRDATVIAFVTDVTDEKRLVLRELVRQGYAVTAIVALYETYDFDEAAGPLIAAGIRNVQHLRDASAVATICRRMLLHGVRMTG